MNDHRTKGSATHGSCCCYWKITKSCCKNRQRHNFSSDYRLTMELDLQKILWAPCAQLYSLAETLQPPPPLPWAHLRGCYGSAKIDDISFAILLVQTNSICTVWHINRNYAFPPLLWYIVCLPKNSQWAPHKKAMDVPLTHPFASSYFPNITFSLPLNRSLPPESLLPTLKQSSLYLYFLSFRFHSSSFASFQSPLKFTPLLSAYLRPPFSLKPPFIAYSYPPFSLPPLIPQSSFFTLPQPPWSLPSVPGQPPSASFKHSLRILFSTSPQPCISLPSLPSASLPAPLSPVSVSPNSPKPSVYRKVSISSS